LLDDNGDEIEFAQRQAVPNRHSESRTGR
jgi:hypothetical protein